MGVEHDFLSYTSFPSSLKCVNPRSQYVGGGDYKGLSVTPGATLRTEVNIKQKDVYESLGYFHINSYYNEERKFLGELITLRRYGSFDWTKVVKEVKAPTDAKWITVDPTFPPGTTEKPAIVWIDDLKIYQDDKLIYRNYFTPWKPVLGVGLGTVIGGVAGVKYPVSRVGRSLPVIAAGLGALIGGAAGVLAPELKLKLPELPLTGEDRCPVCGMLLPEEPLGVDVKCPECGFVSAYTR